MILLSQKQHHRANTLIEILLYFTLLGIFLFSAITFGLQILNVRALSSNLHDLQSDLNMVQKKITYAIQTATSINEAASVFNVHPGALSLTMPVPGQNPTIFTWVDGTVMMQRGIAPAVPLTSSAGYVEQFLVDHIQVPNAPDHLVLDILIHPRGANISQLNLQRTLHLSLSLRQ